MADYERDEILIVSESPEPNSASHEDPRETKIPFSRMGGPIFGAPRPENLHLTQAGGEDSVVELEKQKYPSFRMKDQNDWPEDCHNSKNEHLLRSGQLGTCNAPYCTTCPAHYNSREAKHKISKSSGIFVLFHNALYGDAKGWARIFSSYVSTYIPGVMNPHAKVVQQWKKFFFISCLVAIFVDPLFFFLLGVKSDEKCIVFNKNMTMVIAILRSVTDFIYFLHLLLQFRLAYVAPESGVVGAGDLVDHPKKIIIHYLYGYFFLDLFAALPLPQIMIFVVLRQFNGESPANYAKNILRAAILIQDIPRLYRFLPMLAGHSPAGFVFDSAWAIFVMNLLTVVLSSHIVGSCWYLFGLQRINQCLRDACSPVEMCGFMDCGNGDKIHGFEGISSWPLWTNNINATNCFTEGGFDYGIYLKAVNLTTKTSIITRYVYSLFWGFQQISTLAGNQVPSYFVGEVLFTMTIIGLGLLLFALLIGNMQNFLQSLGKRRLEMLLRLRDVEMWMKHRRLPEELRRRVRQAETYNWAVTRGVNEEMLLGNLPEDLQRDIRSLLCWCGYLPLWMIPSWMRSVRSYGTRHTLREARS